MHRLASDPWGVALAATAGLCALAVLWWLLALMMRQPARGAGRLLSFGLFAYLGVAVGGTAAKVMATPPPAAPVAPAGPPVVISADVPSSDGKAPAKSSANTPDAKGDAKADAAPSDAVASPELAPTPPRPTLTPAATPHVELGAPTLSGREALRFVDAVSHDEARCKDIDEVAKAARELPGALQGVPRTRVVQAAGKLEGCRRKLVWARAFLIRSKRVEDRKRFADELPARMKSEQGLSVLASLRGAASERIRIGGAALDEAKAKALLDAGLRDELADLGFAELTLASTKSAVKETLEVPSDSDLAERELAPKGLDRKIEV